MLVLNVLRQNGFRKIESLLASPVTGRATIVQRMQTQKSNARLDGFQIRAMSEWQEDWPKQRSHYPLEAPERQRRLGGEVKQLSNAELEMALDNAILSKGMAELALIYLIDRYKFDIKALTRKARLVGMQFKSLLLQ